MKKPKVMSGVYTIPTKDPQTELKELIDWNNSQEYEHDNPITRRAICENRKTIHHMLDNIPELKGVKIQLKNFGF